MKTISSIGRNIAILIVVITATLVFPLAAFSQFNGESLTALDVSPDSTLYAAGFHNASVKVWNASTHELLQTYPRPQNVRVDANEFFRVNDVAFSPDGTRLAVSYGGWIELGVVQIFNVNTGNLLQRIETSGPAGKLAWDPDGNHVAGSVDVGIGMVTSHYLRIWDAAMGTLLTEMELPSSAALSVEWSPDGNYLAHPWPDGIIVRNTTTWEAVVTLPASNGTAVVAWSQDGSKLAVTDFATVQVWNTSNWQQLAMFNKQVVATQGLPLIAWSTDGIHIASTSDRILEGWDIITQ